MVEAGLLNRAVSAEVLRPPLTDVSRLFPLTSEWRIEENCVVTGADRMLLPVFDPTESRAHDDPPSYNLGDVRNAESLWLFPTALNVKLNHVHVKMKCCSKVVKSPWFKA